MFHELTKYIEINCHVVHENITQDLIKLLRITYSLQVVDFFTKLLLPQPFNHLRSKLGMRDTYSQLEEG